MTIPPTPGPAQRYVVERCPGGGDRVEVLDLTRKPLRRVVARTSWADAHMIADALNGQLYEKWLTEIDVGFEQRSEG